MALSQEQEAFLAHPPTQSARVLAGPGTGKSYTSTAYLEKVTREDPELRVGYITFTRAATAEFAKKLADTDLAAQGGQPPKTMHGFALGLLIERHSSRLPYPLRIPDSWEAEKLIRPDISRLLKARGYDQASLKVVGQLEGELAANFDSLEGARLPLASEEPALTNAYRGVWESHRRSYGYTLLSELPYQAGGVLEDMDEGDLGVDLVIVDEFQDLNAADQRVLKLLADRGIAIIAIGDDDQSIYSWRNAAPDGIRGFPSNFGTAYDYPLSVSQRCGGLALTVANSLIEQDSNRPHKPRLAPSDRAPDTGFHYLRFNSNMAEAKGVAAIVASRLAAGIEPTDIAILARSSLPAWVRELHTVFEELGIPLSPPADLREVLSDRGIRTALAVGQLSQNLYDSLAWRALLEVTPKIGPVAVDHVYASDTEGSFAVRLLTLHAEGFAGFRGRALMVALIDSILPMVTQAQDAAAPETEGGWAGWLADLVGRELFGPDALALFLAVGEQLGTGEPVSRFVNEFEPSLKDLTGGSVEGVRIMTMGMSKGLTVNTAIVMGVESGNVPSLARDLDEERRLLYVAMTRATDLTVVCYTNRRKGPTARVGDPRVWVQREQSTFMIGVPEARLENGEVFVTGLTRG